MAHSTQSNPANSRPSAAASVFVPDCAASVAGTTRVWIVIP